MSRCDATIDGSIRCELAPGHTGRHAHGLLVWHEPPLILVDGQPPSMEPSDHWTGAEVRFTGETA